MLLGWPRTKTRQTGGDLGENQILLFYKRNMAIKWHLMTFCHTHRSVPCSAAIRDTSSCSRWKQIESHSQTLCRVRDLRSPSPDPPLKDQGSMWKKIQKDNKCQRPVMSGLKEIIFVLIYCFLDTTEHIWVHCSHKTCASSRHTESQHGAFREEQWTTGNW